MRTRSSASPFLLSFASLALAGLASAQTFIVDETGAGDFVDIAPAVAAVPEGATLRVRVGRYNPFTITGKSLKVLCDLGAHVYRQHGSWVGVTGLAANQSVVIQGLNLVAGWGFPRSVGCTSCAGPVLFDGLASDNQSTGTISATDCAQVLVRGRSLGANWRTSVLTNSNVVFERVAFAPGLFGLSMTMTGGTLQAVGCAFQAGVPYQTYPGGAMVLAQGANVRLLAGTTVSGFPTTTYTWFDGAGTVVHDPSIVLPAGVVAPTVTAVAQEMPALTSTFVPGAATASLAGALGHFGVIGVALPGPVTALPGIDGALWVDAASFFPVAFGVVGAGAPVTAQLPWNGGPVPAVRATWQALTFAPSGTLHLSNPSFTLLP